MSRPFILPEPPHRMRIRIHRGTAEIGGNCIEVEASGRSILLDLGMPLMGDLRPMQAMPPVPGLLDGTNARLLGIVISHPHADHYGLVPFAHPSIPIYMGAEADRLLRAASAFTSFGAAFPMTVHYRHRTPFSIGPFRITPFLMDHSAFDAYFLLIEADGRRLFYSGDLRGHGWKSKLFRDLLARPPRNLDVMLLEGTNLGRYNPSRSVETEAELADGISKIIASTKGIVLAAFSGQNVDRFVTFYKAARQARRIFVADLYLAHLLRSIGRKSLPDPAGSDLRIYLPRRDKLKMVRTGRFDLAQPYRRRRIYPSEIKDLQAALVMSFRASMAAELEKVGCLADGLLVYSMWPGYLERGALDLRGWAARNGMAFEVMHTSGHAGSEELGRLVRALSPRTLVPIHTLAPERFRQFGCEVRPVRDGTWIAL